VNPFKDLGIYKNEMLQIYKGKNLLEVKLNDLRDRVTLINDDY
jgi:hypothetical protein